MEKLYYISIEYFSFLKLKHYVAEKKGIFAGIFEIPVV